MSEEYIANAERRTRIADDMAWSSGYAAGRAAALAAQPESAGLDVERESAELDVERGATIIVSSIPALYRAWRDSPNEIARTFNALLYNTAREWYERYCDCMGDPDPNIARLPAEKGATE